MQISPVIVKYSCECVRVFYAPNHRAGLYGGEHQVNLHNKKLLEACLCPWCLTNRTGADIQILITTDQEMLFARRNYEPPLLIHRK